MDSVLRVWSMSPINTVAVSHLARKIIAKVFATNLLKNKKVKLTFDVQKTDRYGRILAYAYLENGVFLNQYLVENGFAVVATFPPNVKFVEVFTKAEKSARNKKLGLWK